MASTKYLRGKVIRFTKLDRCGNRVLGPDSTITTDAFITLGLTANTFQKAAVQQENANGDRCINDKPRPKLEDFTVNLTLCGADPNVLNFLTGSPLVYDDTAVTPLAYGIDLTDDVDAESVAVAIEVWSDTPSDGCVSGIPIYGYALLPRVGGGVIGDQSWENGAINFSINGMTTKRNNAWGIGPYNVELDLNGIQVPLLQPMPVNSHQRIIPVEVPPPVAAAAPTALGVPATNANSTTTNPATLTPANSYAPKNLAEAIALGAAFTATPTTSWVAGKYALTRSGQKIRWNATAWVAAP